MVYRDLFSEKTEGFRVSSRDTLGTAIQQIVKRKGCSVAVFSGEKPLGILTSALALTVLTKGSNAETPVGSLELEAAMVSNAADQVKESDFAETTLRLIREDDGSWIGIVDKVNALSCILTSFDMKTQKALHDLEYFGRRKIVFDSSEQNLDKLAESANILRKALALSPDSIFLVDRNGVILFVNDIFLKLSMRQPEEVIGKTVMEMQKEGYFNPPVSLLVLKSGKEVTIRQYSNMYNAFWVTTGAPIFDDLGEVDMVVTNARNIAEYKKFYEYEENRKKNIRKGNEEGKSRQRYLFSGKHMQHVTELADKAAEIDSTVLITGESGVGKGVLARRIHQRSLRNAQRMVEVNCSSIPESLFESEFFGYESGAFTGASASGKPGIFELADKGTLFLDEVGDMPLILQAKLLRALQEQKITRVGGVSEISVNVRVIAATNQPIEELVESGRFRADLYYRLNMFPIHILPLRERREEIPGLIKFFLLFYSQRYLKDISLSEQLVERLSQWPWPGNVRQLEYYIERIVILFSGELSEADIVQGVSAGEKSLARKNPNSFYLEGEPITVHGIIPLEEALEETTKQLFRLAAADGKSSYQIAELLKTSQPNAYRKMKKYCRK